MKSYRRVSVASDVHLCKRTDVANSDHFHSEVPEEVNDFQRLVPQEENENKGSNNGAQQLLQDKHLMTTQEKHLFHSQQYKETMDRRV